MKPNQIKDRSPARLNVVFQYNVAWFSMILPPFLCMQISDPPLFALALPSIINDRSHIYYKTWKVAFSTFVNNSVHLSMFTNLYMSQMAYAFYGYLYKLYICICHFCARNITYAHSKNRIKSFYKIQMSLFQIPAFRCYV